MCTWSEPARTEHGSRLLLLFLQLSSAVFFISKFISLYPYQEGHTTFDFLQLLFFTVYLLFLFIISLFNVCKNCFSYRNNQCKKMHFSYFLLKQKASNRLILFKQYTICLMFPCLIQDKLILKGPQHPVAFTFL